MALLTLAIFVIHQFLGGGFWFFDNLIKKTYAEEQLDKQDIVLVLVDNNLYGDLKEELTRYGVDYIQTQNPNTIALILPIDPKEPAIEILKIIQNLYFAGIESQPSSLKGIVLIGELPLPVVNDEGVIFPTIWPYVDLKNAEFVYQKSNRYFVPTHQWDKKAEIWHGRILMENIQDYKNYFLKLKSYKESANFVNDKIWYDNFLLDSNTFNPQNFKLYLLGQIFAQDRAYHRYSDKLLTLLQNLFSKDVAKKLDDVTSDITHYISQEDDIAQTADEYMNRYVDKSKEALSRIKDYANTTLTQLEKYISQDVQINVPTYQEFLFAEKNYFKSFNESFGSSRNDNLVRDLEALWYNDFWKIDSTAKFMDINWAKILNLYNQQLEESIKEQAYEYALKDLVPRGYVHREWKSLRCVYDTERDIERTSRNLALYQEYSGYYFGASVKNITTPLPFYFGDFWSGNIEGANYGFGGESVGALKWFLAQQVEANRWYNLLNIEKDQKDAEAAMENNCLSKRILTARGGATPLNLDDDQTLKGFLPNLMFSDIFDRGGMKVSTIEHLNDFRGFKDYIYLNFVRNRPGGSFVFERDPCARNTSNPYKRAKDVDFFVEAVKKYEQDATSDDSSTRINIFSWDKLVASRWTGAIISYGCSDIDVVEKYSEKYSQYDYKIFPTVILHDHPTQKDIAEINPVTLDRGIDEKRGVSFKGVGGDFLRWDFPNLLEVQVFTGGQGVYVLKDPKQIEESIKKYLRHKTAEYNRYLQEQLNKKEDYIALYKTWFSLLASVDPKLVPFDYELLPEEFLIKTLGEEKIKEIAHILWLQNQWWDSLNVSGSTVNDTINSFLAQYNIEKKVLSLIQTYLYFDKESYLPAYQRWWYQIGVWVGEPNYWQDVTDFSQDKNYSFLEKLIKDNKDKDLSSYTSPANISELLQAQTNLADDACGIPPDGKVSIWEWMGKISCRLNQISSFSSEDVIKITPNQCKIKVGGATSGVYKNFEKLKELGVEELLVDEQPLNWKWKIVLTTSKPVVFKIVSSWWCVEIQNVNSCDQQIEIKLNGQEQVPFTVISTPNGAVTLQMNLCDDNNDNCIDINKKIIIPASPHALALEVSPSVVPLWGQAQVYVKLLDDNGNQIRYLVQPIKLQTSLGDLISWLGEKGDNIEIYDVEKPIIVDFSKLWALTPGETVVLKASYWDLQIQKQIKISDIDASLKSLEIVSGNYQQSDMQLWKGKIYLNIWSSPYSYFVKLSSKEGRVVPGVLSGQNFIPQEIFAIPEQGKEIAILRIPYEDTEELVVDIAGQKKVLQKFDPLIWPPFKVVLSGPTQLKQKNNFNVEIVDRRGNKVRDKTVLEVYGSSNLSFPATVVAVDGKATIPVLPRGVGKAWLGVKIRWDDETLPAIKQLQILDDSYIDFWRLNIAYFNRFGVGGGNIWGYLDKKYKAPMEFLGKSDKGIAFTTMLVSPSNLKKSAAILSDTQVLTRQKVILQGWNKTMLLWKGWKLPVRIKMFDAYLSSVGKAMWLSEGANSILKWQEKIISYKDGNLDIWEDVKLEIRNNKGYIIYQWREIWGFSVKFDNILQNEPIVLTQHLTAIIGRAEGTTNWEKWWVILDDTVPYQKLYSKGVEGVSKENPYPVGFREWFKNISYFVWGNSIWEATKPFQTPFLINFWDPLFKNNFDKSLVSNTRYSRDLWQNVFFDEENIASVDVGDFNNDGLDDLFVFKMNGEVKLLKNYWWKSPQAFEELWNLIKLPLPIVKWWVGNVDGDWFEDIIIKTKEWDLFVFFNHRGIIEINPYPLCFREDKTNISQLFVDDFDGDWFEDVLINSKVNGIRLFYGWRDTPFVSEDPKECKIKNKIDVKTLKSWEILLDSSIKKDLSIIRWQWLETPTKDSPEEVKNILNWGIENAQNLYEPINRLGWPWKFILPPIMIPSLYNWYMKQTPSLPAQFTEDVWKAQDMNLSYGVEQLKYTLLPSKFGFEEDKQQWDDVAFANIIYLTWTDPFEVWKFFEGPKVLKPGDRVEVHIVFRWASRPVVYYEKLLGPWEVPTQNGQIDFRFSGNIKWDILLGSEHVPAWFLFWFSGQVGNGQIIYPVIYKGWVGYKVETEKVNKDPQGKLKNTLPNLIFLPTDGCQKKYEYWTNENNLWGDTRNYQKELIDVAEYERQKQQDQQQRLQEIQQNLSLERLDTLLPPEINSCDGDQVTVDQAISEDLLSFWESLLNGKCGWGSECGLPVPFNMAFFSPGMYNIWGLPIAFDPGLTVTPWTFPWFRLYLSPTLTMNLGIAACFGPYMVDIPPPFGVVAWKCLVTAIDLPCDNSWTQTCSAGTNTNINSNFSDDGMPPQQAIGGMLRCKNPLPGIDTSLISPLVLSQGGEGSYVGNYDQVTIKEEFNITMGADGLASIEWIQLQPGYDVWASIQDGLIVGLVESLIKGWLDKQIEYIINNFTHFSIYVILPKLDDLWKGFSSLDFSQLAKALNDDAETFNWPVKEAFGASQRFTLNPFGELQKMFENVPLIDIKKKDINIQYPDVSSSWFVVFEAQLNSWAQEVDLRIKQREEALANLENLPTKGLTTAEQQLNKQREALIKDVLQKLKQNQEVLKYNIEMIKAYQRLPLKLYEYKHIIDQGIDAILCVLEDFLGSINQWLSDNANRFEAWVDAIVLGLNAIDTFQVIIDFTVNWKSKCGKCRVDNYDFHSFITSLLSIDLPIIPIPPFKLPDIYIDLSKIQLGATIVLPNLNFKPYKLELPRLPTIPPPPATYLSIDPKLKIDIPVMQKLPPPPDLPEISIGLPKIELNLPVLPPAPEVPDLMPSLKAIVDVMDVLGNIVFCLIKWWIGLVAEWSVKSRIEQLTQRKQRLFPFDYLRVRIPQPPLKGKDLLLETQIGLEITLEPLYNQLKGFADYRNSQLDSTLRQFKTQLESITNQIDEAQINNININLQPQLELPSPTQGYNFISPQQALKHIDTWIVTIDKAYSVANLSQRQKLDKIKNRLILLKNLEITPNTKEIDQISADLKNYLDYYKKLQFQKIQRIQTQPSSLSLVNTSNIWNLTLKTSLFKAKLSPSVAFAQQQSLSVPPSISQWEVVSVDGALWDRWDDEKYYNVMWDTKLAQEVYQNRQYIKKDINHDGVLDILRRDKNTANIKFGKNNSFVWSKVVNFNTQSYLAPIRRKDKLQQGVLIINWRRFVINNNIWTSRLKTTFQSYNNVKRRWYNIGWVDEYGLTLKLRIDDFVDKWYWSQKYNLDSHKFSISQTEQLAKNMIFADLNVPWIDITVGEHHVPQRKWRYGKVDYSGGVWTYLDVGGRSLLWDKEPPVVWVIISRPATDEKRVWTVFRGLINTHYLLTITANDNVEVTDLALLSETGVIVSKSSWEDLKVDLFSLQPMQKIFMVVAKDWKWNIATEKISLVLDLPQLNIDSALSSSNMLDLQALLSQDVDEGVVKFQVCTEALSGDCVWEDIRNIPVQQLYLFPQKDEVKGSIWFDGWIKIITSDGQQIAMINLKTLEVKKLLPEVKTGVNFKNWLAQLHIQYQGKIIYEIPLVGKRLQDVKVLSPLYMLKELPQGYCVVQWLDNECRALLNYSWSLFVREPYNDLWQWTYGWDDETVKITVEDEQKRGIIIYKFKPGVLIWD